MSSEALSQAKLELYRAVVGSRLQGVAQITRSEVCSAAMAWWEDFGPALDRVALAAERALTYLNCGDRAGANAFMGDYQLFKKEFAKALTLAPI